jgi:hypothetical protein
MESSNILHLPQNDDERERLKTQTTKESEDTLHHYGCALAARGFESWSAIVGGILKFAGVNGFLDNLESMYRDTAGDDDDCAQWEGWVSEIYAYFKELPFTIKELAKAMNGMYSESLKDAAPYALDDVGTPDDRAWLTKLGLALFNHTWRVFGIEDGEERKTVKLIRHTTDGHTRQKAYRLAVLNEK